MQSDLPKTINEALKILAYNDYFWPDHRTNQINPHPKDRETVRSLAESQYAWTEKQARLAVVILKRYLSKFQAHQMDIKSLLDNPVYEDDFRVISFDKSIEKYTDEDGVDKIELRFPYDKKIIQLIRCLKDKRDLPGMYALYAGEDKKWTFLHTDVTAYYLTMIAVRYDFKFVTPELLDDFDAVRKQIVGHRQPTARQTEDGIIIDNAPESLTEHWAENISKLPLLQQVDALKNFSISSTGISVSSKSKLAGRIAHHEYHKLWINSVACTKQEVVQALLELDAFPLLMPCHSDVHEEQEIKEFWDWLKIFESHGIDMMKQCAWGFDLKEPVYRKEDRGYSARTTVIDDKKPREFFENLYELHQMSKQFKFIDDTTKIIFVRNRIPRALIKSKVKPRASLIALGGGYYATGTDNLKRLLENLPKKLYYSDHQPSSWDWHDHVIERV
jgi:hypothetical protein